mmetsp:Transcript_11530/g.18821  ORF Transcript_11530/g.18821 Transcript_11530/m.18821 type:complete len:406 (+) Transcript_11530:329-1546(+)
MGCSSSVEFVVNNKPGQDEYAMMFFDMICLQQSDVNVLYNLFLEIDVRESGYISHDDIFFKYRLDKTDFYRRLLSSGVGEDKERMLFSEYVAIFWNFLSLDEGLLSSLIYYLFDDDNSDSLDFDEIKTLVEVIHQKSYDSSSGVRHMVDSINNYYVDVSKAQFRAICRKNHNIISPIAGMQFNLRKLLKGDLFWNKICKIREADARMSNIEFVFQCIKETEAIRVARARELRLSSLSKDKERINASKHRKRVSNDKGKLERGSSKVFASETDMDSDPAGEDGVGDGGGEKLKRSRSKSGGGEKVKRQSSKKNISRQESGGNVNVGGDVSGRKARPKSAKSPGDIMGHDKEIGDDGGRALKRSKSKRMKKSSSGLSGGEDENGKLKLEPIKKKSKSKSKSKSKKEQ